MIANPSQQRHTSIALAGQRVVLTTKTKLRFARGGEQGSGVVHRAGEHAELIFDGGARTEKCAIQFNPLLSGERQS